MQIIIRFVHWIPGVHGRYWVWSWHCWCRGFNQSCLSIAVIMFVMDETASCQLIDWIYTRVSRKRAARILIIPVSLRATSATIHKFLEPQRGSSWNLRNTLETEKPRNNVRSPTFSGKSGIYRFWRCLGLDMMLSERELRQFELRSNDFLMLVCTEKLSW